MIGIEIGAGGETPPLEGLLQVDMCGEPDVRADIRALPFRHTLDRIYASHVLEHVPDGEIVPTLKSCRGALRQGGILELYVPDLQWQMRRFLDHRMAYGERWGLWVRLIFGSQENVGQFHHTGFSAKRLADCLTAARFREIKVRRTKRKQRSIPGFEQMEIHALAIA